MNSMELPPASYAMGLTPFGHDGDIDEGALRAHVQWFAREGVGFWPASPATGEGSLMSDAEVMRVWEVVVEEVAGSSPVVAGSREFPTAAQNLEHAREAEARGVDAMQLYPPTLGHSAVPTVEMFTAFYDEVLSSVSTPVVLSSNFMTGFEVPIAVIEAIVTHPRVFGVFKHHPDQQNVSEFVQRVSPHTTVLTMAQRSMFSVVLGATAHLDNLQNIAPRTCRALHDALQRHDMETAGELYGHVTALVSGVMHVSSAFSVPRVVVYKAILGLLGQPGGHARRPYLEPAAEVLAALTRMVDGTGLRELEGLSSRSLTGGFR